MVRTTSGKKRVKANFPTCTRPFTSKDPPVFVAGPTVSTSDADCLAAAVIQQNLPGCVQIEGPMTALDRWKRKIDVRRENGLTFKCLAETLLPLETYVPALH